MCSLLLRERAGDIKAASELRQEIIKNVGADSIYATQDGGAAASESGEGSEVKTFVTDTTLVTKVKGSGPGSNPLPPVNEDPNVNTAVEDPTVRKRAGTVVLPTSVTHATRPKKKKPTATAI
jgi:hypothetical protein